MDNLDIVLRSVYNAKSQIFTSSYNGCISSRNKCNFKLGSVELFPTMKPMSSTSKTILNSYTIDNHTTNYLCYDLFEGVCFGRRRCVAVLKS
jgi:hypothetical protein